MIPVYVVTADCEVEGQEVVAAFHTEGEARMYYAEHRKAHPYDRPVLLLTAWDGGESEVILRPCVEGTLSGGGRFCDKVAGHLGPHADTAHAEYLASWSKFMGNP